MPLYGSDKWELISYFLLLLSMILVTLLVRQGLLEAYDWVATLKFLAHPERGQEGSGLRAAIAG